eukprot:6409056-Prymnesium_polylepis.1
MPGTCGTIAEELAAGAPLHIGAPSPAGVALAAVSATTRSVSSSVIGWSLLPSPPARAAWNTTGGWTPGWIGVPPPTSGGGGSTSGPARPSWCSSA